MCIEKHVVKEVAQNLSEKLPEGDSGASRAGVLPERTENHTMQFGGVLPPTTRLRAQFSIPADSHIFLLPGESAKRFGLIEAREEMPSCFLL